MTRTLIRIAAAFAAVVLAVPAAPASKPQITEEAAAPVFEAEPETAEQAGTYPVRLLAAWDREGRLVLTVFAADGKEKKGSILALPAREEDLAKGTVIDSGLYADGVSCVYAPGKITDHYVFAEETPEGWRQLSGFAYISNAGVYSDAADYTFAPNGKKGIRIRTDQVQDALTLGAAVAETELTLSAYLTRAGAGTETISWSDGGTELLLDRAEVEKLDRMVSELTSHRVAVALRLVCDLEEPEHLTAFLASRYDGSRSEYGLVTYWTLAPPAENASAADEAWLGRVRDFSRSFHLMYNEICVRIPGAKIYVPLQAFPTAGADIAFPGESFLNAFYALTASEGDIGWGLAPGLVQEYAGENTEGLITLSELERTREALLQKTFLRPDGSARRILLIGEMSSESGEAGTSEALQAAWMAAAYYRAETAEEIDVFIESALRDDAGSGKSTGLLDAAGRQKLAWTVFGRMDSADSIETLSMLKQILGIAEWTELIPDFREQMLEQRSGTDLPYEERIDLAEGRIEPVTAQEFTGQACRPAVTVTFDGQILTEDVDYDTVWLNNTAKGSATVLAVGIGAYTGILKTAFVIR